MPKTGWTTYIEPMVGGGAVFFAMRAAGLLDDKRVVLADADPEIIQLYTAIRDNPVDVIIELERLALLHQRTKHPSDHFARVRDAWNDEGARSPARQLYLRYAGFNGLWRYSKGGRWNVPWNQKRELFVPSASDLMSAAIALEDVELVCADFRALTPGSDALLYCDPPYDSLPKAGQKKGAGFVAYTAAGFTDADQEALILHLSTGAKQGAHVVYSNAATPKIKALLRKHWPTAAIYRVANRRAIAADARVRGDVKELLVIGGPPEATIAP